MITSCTYFQSPHLPHPFNLSAFSPTPRGSSSPLGSPAAHLLLARASPNSPAVNTTPSDNGTGSEPRRRAPRALTGRYVRSGTGASPKTLEILRRKILERMKLKELLGPENSHLYFGPVKTNNGNKKHAAVGSLFPRKNK